MSGRDKGGNTTQVTFNGKKTDLHTVWDSSLIDKRAENFDSLYAYQTYLLSLFRSSVWEDSVQWPKCFPKMKNVFFEMNYLCPFEWASDINQLNCSFVFRDIDQDLAGKYFQSSLPIVERSLVMAGVRLAYVLESILTRLE